MNPTDKTGNELGRIYKYIGQYSIREEFWNSLSHAIGVVFGILGSIYLLILAVINDHNGWSIAAAVIYGISLIATYTSSTLYHWLRRPRYKYYLKIMDHISIFLLIAGTYTPFILIKMQNNMGAIFLSIIWALAIAGIILKIFFTGRFELISTLIYLLLGWSVVPIVKYVIEALPMDAIWLAVAGGAFYTFGAIIYMIRKIPYAHTIWHFFVLGGSICQYIAVVLLLK